MSTYTIKFQSNDQDNLAFIPFNVGDKMPCNLDFDTVLASSIRQEYIQNKAEIKTLVTGSDEVQPYFTSETAADDCKATLEADYGLKFKKSQTVYEL